MDQSISGALAARQRVREAALALAAEGVPVTAVGVAARAEVDDTFLYRHRDLLADVRALRELQRSGREIDAFALDEYHERTDARGREMVAAARSAIDRLERERLAIEFKQVAHRARVPLAYLHENAGLAAEIVARRARQIEGDAAARARRAVDALEHEGSRITFVTVAERSGIPRKSLYEHALVRSMIESRRAAQDAAVGQLVDEMRRRIDIGEAELVVGSLAAQFGATSAVVRCALGVLMDEGLVVKRGIRYNVVRIKPVDHSPARRSDAVRLAILAAILNGDIRAGDPVPNHRNLAAQLEVSRTAVALGTTPLVGPILVRDGSLLKIATTVTKATARAALRRSTQGAGGPPRSQPSQRSTRAARAAQVAQVAAGLEAEIAGKLGPGTPLPAYKLTARARAGSGVVRSAVLLLGEHDLLRGGGRGEVWRVRPAGYLGPRNWVLPLGHGMLVHLADPQRPRQSAFVRLTTQGTVAVAGVVGREPRGPWAVATSATSIGEVLRTEFGALCDVARAGLDAVVDPDARRRLDWGELVDRIDGSGHWPGIPTRDAVLEVYALGPGIRGGQLCYWWHAPGRRGLTGDGGFVAVTRREGLVQVVEAGTNGVPLPGGRQMSVPATQLIASVDRGNCVAIHVAVNLLAGELLESAVR